MLHLAPERVDMRQARNFRSAWLDRAPEFTALVPEGGIGFGWQTQDLHPAGALGDASRATAAGGAAIVAHIAARFVQLLAEVRRFDLDTWLRDDPEELPNR
jgi:creatinine amidohydrolase